MEKSDERVFGRSNGAEEDHNKAFQLLSHQIKISATRRNNSSVNFMPES
jgi:hypothetical protein